MKKIKCSNPQCRNETTEEHTGRHKRYCSDKCKQAAYRDRKGASPRKRKEVNTVYTSTLEKMIIEFWSSGDGAGANALMELAIRIGAPINMLYIESQGQPGQCKPLIRCTIAILTGSAMKRNTG